MCDKNELYTSQFEHLNGDEYFRAINGAGESETPQIDFRRLVEAVGIVSLNQETVPDDREYEGI